MDPVKDKHGVRESFAKATCSFAKICGAGLKEIRSITMQIANACMCPSAVVFPPEWIDIQVPCTAPFMETDRDEDSTSNLYALRNPVIHCTTMHNETARPF